MVGHIIKGDNHDARDTTNNACCSQCIYNNHMMHQLHQLIDNIVIWGGDGPLVVDLLYGNIIGIIRTLR